VQNSIGGFAACIFQAFCFVSKSATVLSKAFYASQHKPPLQAVCEIVIALLKSTPRITARFVFKVFS